MKIIPLAFLGAFTFLSLAQQTQNIKQQIQSIIQEEQKKIQEKFSDQQKHQKEFQQVEAQVNRILQDLPDNIGLPIEQIQAIVLRFFLQNNPGNQEIEEKISKYFKHIVEEHQGKFGTFGKDLPNLPEQEDQDKFKTIENQIVDEVSSQSVPQSQAEAEKSQQPKENEEEGSTEEKTEEEKTVKEEQSNQEGEEEIQDKP